MKVFYMLIRKLKVNFLSVLLFGSFIGLSFSCNDDLSLNMPQFRTNEIKKGDRIMMDMTGSVSKSALRAMDGSSGQFDVANNGTNDVFIHYKDMENIPCVMLFKNDATNESFFAEGKAEIDVPDNIDETTISRNDKVLLKIRVNTNTGYALSGDWQVKPIIGFKKTPGTNVFAPVDENKTTGKSTDDLSIPITADWIRLSSANVNAEKHVTLKNVSFRPDGMLFNVSVTSEFADPICISKIRNLGNSKIAFNSGYDMGNNGMPTAGKNEICIAEDVDSDGNHLYGLIPNSSSKLENIFVWANIYKTGTEDLSCHYVFTPVSRDPFKDKSKKYSRKFASPYMYLDWTPKNLASYTPIKNGEGMGKTYSLNMVARSMDYPMITEVYVNGPYSMVEIYNPTTRPIPLENFFIIKTKSNGELTTDSEGYDKYTSDGYPYAQRGSLGLPLYIGPNHDNSTYNIYERKFSSSDLVIFGDDDTNIISNPNALIASSNIKVLGAGKTMILAGPGYINRDGSFNRDAYNKYAPKDDLSVTKSDIQIFLVADNSGYSSQTQATTGTKDIEATLNISNNEGLAIIQKKDNTVVTSRTADKYLVVDVFPFDNGRATKAIPFYMCRYDGIVYPFTRSSSLEDATVGGIKREGLNSQWYLNEIKGTEQIHSIGARYRNW